MRVIDRKNVSSDRHSIRPIISALLIFADCEYRTPAGAHSK
jgi:hypothetical protein